MSFAEAVEATELMGKVCEKVKISIEVAVDQHVDKCPEGGTQDEIRKA